MTRLSVNLNKVALVRNSRSGAIGGGRPDLLVAARIAIAAGCHGLTLHPRFDGRHALLSDVKNLATLPEVLAGQIELNIEGDIREELLQLAKDCRVQQVTLVPVQLGEKTSERGWHYSDDIAALTAAVTFVKTFARASIFLDPDVKYLPLAAKVGASAVEFYTGGFAKMTAENCDENDYRLLLQNITNLAAAARNIGLQVHLGHDLDLNNLQILINAVKPDEVSIGHALISDAILNGLGNVTAQYAAICLD